MVFLFGLYCLFFAALIWKNFRAAIFLFVVLLPTYLVRFEWLQIGKYPFPSTLLEVTFGLISLVWVVRYARVDIKRIIFFFKIHRLFAIAWALFFLSSVVSVFVSDMVFFSLGEWRAYFFEPMIFFLILIGRSEMFLPVDLLLALAVSTVSISVYAIVQKYTGMGIATPEWANEATRRVTAFFSSPNAVGLYVAPVLMLMSAMLVRQIKQLIQLGIKGKNIFFQPAIFGLLFAIISAFGALVFTKSQGTLIGLGAGTLVFLFLIDFRKIAIGLAVIGVIFSLLIPSMRQAVLFQDQANQNRLRLWGYSWIFLTKTPQNFIFGTGVRQFFRKIQKPYYDTRVMERLIYPHNIFLNFWTEIGLAGMLAAVAMIGYVGFIAYKVRANDQVLGAGMVAMLTVLVVHGLVDVPYFKNDLAFLFWILIASIFMVYAHTSQGKTERV